MFAPWTNVDESCDVSMLAGANMLTTTAQFSAVYLWNTSTNDNGEVRIVDTTTAYPLARGINQTYFTSGSAGTGGGSPAARIRFGGVSAALGTTGITAGDFLKCGAAGIMVSKVSFSGAVLTTTALSIGTEAAIVGIALQSVITTGTKFAMFVKPSWTIQV